MSAQVAVILWVVYAIALKLVMLALDPKFRKVYGKWGSPTRPFHILRNYEYLIYEFQDGDAFYTALKNNVIWLFLYLLAIPAGLFIALFLSQAVTGIRLYKSQFFFPL